MTDHFRRCGNCVRCGYAIFTFRKDSIFEGLCAWCCAKELKDDPRHIVPRRLLAPARAFFDNVPDHHIAEQLAWDRAEVRALRAKLSRLMVAAE